MPLFNPLTVEVQEDGTPEGQVNTLNFTGDISVSVTGATADINVTSSGGSPLLPTTGTGTATGAVTGDLATNDLTIINGGAVAETANSFTRTADTHTINAGGQPNLVVTLPNSQIRGFNATGDGNQGFFVGEASATDAKSRIKADFNDGVKVAVIEAVADATTSTITHTADTHTIIAPVSFTVTDGGNNQIDINATAFATTIKATDGNGTSKLELLGDLVGNSVKFNLASSDGSPNPVSIEGDGQASTITHTADQHTINGLVDITGATDIVGNSTITGTLTMTGAVKSSSNNADDIGDSTNSFKDIYARRVRLDGATSGTVDIISDALSNAPNGTTLSGAGYMPCTMFSRLTGNFTMSDVNTVQPVFGTGQDVWTLQGATTYRFKGQYYLTHGAASHSLGMSFELAGGASVTGISYTTVCWVTAAGSTTASQTTTLTNVATNVAVNFAGANAQETVAFEGWLTMNAGGTVTPSITFSAAPGGAPAAVAYATWIEFTPIATNTATSLGNVA